MKAGAVEYANLSKKYIKLKSNFDQVLIKQVNKQLILENFLTLEFFF